MSASLRRIRAESQNATPQVPTVGVLDGVTQLDAEASDAAWTAVLYPSAGEAAIFWSPAAGGGNMRHREPEGGQGRARRRVRRYSLANHLSRLVTLTFRDAERDLKRGRRRLKRALSAVRGKIGAPFPYISVVEEHPGGHGLHVHLLVRASAADHLSRTWTFGHVDVVELATRDELREAAAYVAKDFDKDAHGRHRYEVAQGFKPERQRLISPTRGQLWEWLRELMGSAPAEVKSYENLGWPLWVAWWNTQQTTRGDSS